MIKCKCKICGKKYSYNRKKGHKKTVCNSCNVVLFRRKRKRMAIEYKGGKCVFCGYDKCQDALGFHHLESEKKEFGLSSSTGLCRSWEKVKKELDKCILVCANCHAEIHAGYPSGMGLGC